MEQQGNTRIIKSHLGNYNIAVRWEKIYQFFIMILVVAAGYQHKLSAFIFLVDQKKGCGYIRRKESTKWVSDDYKTYKPNDDDPEENKQHRG